MKVLIIFILRNKACTFKCEETTNTPLIRSFIQAENDESFQISNSQRRKGISKTKRKKQNNSIAVRNSHNISFEDENLRNSFNGKVRVRTGANQWKSIESSPRTKVLQSKRKQVINQKIMKKILDFKAMRVQQEQEQLQQQRLLEKAERKKYRTEVEKRMKRNQKLKKQLQEWEKQKEEKEKRVLETLKKQEERKQAQTKRAQELRASQLEKLQEYRVRKDQKSQSQINPKKYEKERFLQEIYLKQLRLKQELKKLRKSQKAGIPRYDLNTSELIKPVKANSSRDDIIKEEPENSTHKSKSPRGLNKYLRKYGQNHIEAVSHLNTTVSALGIYNNPLPVLKRFYS
ncbi:unnamed protein product [Moneuplotes crassus]|uniref:Uncharacterized protein n=1 Tax=Euplotes crassus TaxID=5936 RepID=A0AAD1UBF3_EUPCR|nr:unnamed protein product [Moneuplotes crassus]